MEHTGEHFGPFRVFEKLGKGGSASVWRATRRCDDGSELEVSLKRLHPHLADDTDAVRRFVNEAEIASVLCHDNICRFYELGRLDDQLFISMEYLDGVDLRRLLQEAHDARRPPPFAVTLSLLSQLCDAMEYAHNLADDKTGASLDLVHRDISPSNLIVTRDGRLKLIDLGIAKTRTTAFKTKTGLIRGKFGYMAPEVLRGSSADQRADIYSVGVVAWELLTAKRLFGRASDVETIERIRIGATEPPSAHNAACAPQVDAIIMRALRRDPRKRWRSAAALRTALHAAAAALHEPISPDVVRTWLDAAHSIPLPAPASESDATTDTHAIEEPTRRTSSRRFATGSAELEAITPPPIPRPTTHSVTDLVAPGEVTAVRQMTEWVQGRLSQEAGRRRVVMWIMGASLLLNIALLVAVLARPGGAPSPEVAPEKSASVASERPAITSDVPKPTARVAPTRAAPNAGAPAPVAPAPAVPAPVVVQRSAADNDTKKPAPAKTEDARVALTVSPPVLFARHPRSKSTRAAYSARVCINKRGRVASVEPTSGPQRLYPRIKRYLSRWRFTPHRVLGERVPACFDVHDRLRRAR